MSNPFYRRIMGTVNSLPNPMNNVNDMLTKFEQFKAQIQGNPQEQVQQLLNTGKMSQEQFNQLSNLARQFQSIAKNSK